MFEINAYDLDWGNLLSDAIDLRLEEMYPNMADRNFAGSQLNYERLYKASLPIFRAWVSSGSEDKVSSLNDLASPYVYWEPVREDLVLRLNCSEQDFYAWADTHLLLPSVVPPRLELVAKAVFNNLNTNEVRFIADKIEL